MVVKKFIFDTGTFHPSSIDKVKSNSRFREPPLVRLFTLDYSGSPSLIKKLLQYCNNFRYITIASLIKHGRPTNFKNYLIKKIMKN